MPELPEVETVRRGLEPTLAGARLSRVEARRPDLRFPLPQGFVQRLTGARIERLRNDVIGAEHRCVAAIGRGHDLGGFDARQAGDGQNIPCAPPARANRPSPGQRNSRSLRAIFDVL